MQLYKILCNAAANIIQQYLMDGPFQRSEVHRTMRQNITDLSKARTLTASTNEPPCPIVGRGGSLVDSAPFTQRVAGSSPALATILNLLILPVSTCQHHSFFQSI